MSELYKRIERSQKAMKVLANPVAAYDETARLKADLDRALARVAELEDFCADKIGRLPLPGDRTSFADGRYSAFWEVYNEATRLRQQADQLENTHD